MYYIVKYSGNFGFIKPFQAMRDDKICSHKFLPFSSLNGIELMIFGDINNRMIKSRLNFDSITYIQETTKSVKGDNPSIISRGILINPILYIVFDSYENALIAYNHHVLLCRNEDILLPESIFEVNSNDFDNINNCEYSGYELHKSDINSGEFISFNRYTNEREYDTIHIYGTPNVMNYCVNSSINE